MAWFLNFYKCDRCRRRWPDEWSCMCDDECPHCGARDMTPFDSENLTGLVEQDGNEFIAFRSPDTGRTRSRLSRTRPFSDAREGRGVFGVG